MKTIIIYASVHHNNTEKIAETMAKQLKAEVLKAKEAQDKNLNNYDLIGFGSGIFHAKFHPSLLKAVEELQIKGNKFFIFSTSGLGKQKYNKSLISLIEDKGGKVIGDFACKGFDTYGIFKWIGGIAKGRPNDEDLKKAEKFAKNLKNK